MILIIVCADPVPEIPNGYIAQKTFFPPSVAYGCNFGYTGVGKNTSSCVPGKNWKPPDYNCASSNMCLMFLWRINLSFGSEHYFDPRNSSVNVIHDSMKHLLDCAQCHPVILLEETLPDVYLNIEYLVIFVPVLFFLLWSLLSPCRLNTGRIYNEFLLLCLLEYR